MLLQPCAVECKERGGVCCSARDEEARGTGHAQHDHLDLQGGRRVLHGARLLPPLLPLHVPRPSSATHT
ncbi:Protein of unknown function [Gryllus bimaculatus]|nr:Protein of unknown function [Gryllus bimaculatus]